MEKNSLIFIAGGRGLVGSAIERRCRALGYRNLLLPAHKELDLCNQQAVDEYFAAKRPEYVFLAAGRVGGIHANNTMPADFIRDNLLIATNIIDAAWRGGTRKLLFLGSSCIYPKLAPQPLREDSLLTGALESTNEWYAVAKLAGLKMGQAYRRQHGFDVITALPTNLYGPGDKFDLETSHVLPALLRKFGEAVESGASQVMLWGALARRGVSSCTSMISRTRASSSCIAILGKSRSMSAAARISRSTIWQCESRASQAFTAGWRSTQVDRTARPGRFWTSRASRRSAGRRRFRSMRASLPPGSGTPA